MEQRKYHGDLSAEALADHLIQFFDPKKDLQAQKIGSGDSVMVQIARGDIPEEKRHSVSVGIARIGGDEPGLRVTVGQQEWFTPGQAKFSLAMGLVGLLLTPWALYALIWPLSDVIAGTGIPTQIWGEIEIWVVSQGGVGAPTEPVSHPMG